MEQDWRETFADHAAPHQATAGHAQIYQQIGRRAFVFINVSVAVEKANAAFADDAIDYMDGIMIALER